MLEDENQITYIGYDDKTALVKDPLKAMLIDWLFEIGERFLQTNLTIHIAIAYLERCYSIGLHLKEKDVVRSENELRILAITCLLLASKYDELDERIPFINDMGSMYR